MPAQVGHSIRSDHRVTRFCGVTAALVGASVLVGWDVDSHFLKSVLPGSATMKTNTALGFLFAGISLWGVGSRWGAGRWVGVLAVWSALAVVVVAVLTLGEYAFDIQIGIDELVFRDAPGSPGTPPPGRMAPVTALLFLMIGAALWSRHSGHASSLGQVLTLSSVVLSAFCCLCYFYGSHSLVAVSPFSSVAVHTAATFLVLSVGLLATSPETGLVALLVSRGIGGVLIRRLLPAAVVLTLFIGWLRLAGERIGWYGPEFGLALFALANVVVFAALVCWVAWRLERTESLRESADRSLRESEQRFARFMQHLAGLAWIKDLQGRYLYASDAALAAFGTSLPNLIGKTDEELFPAETAAKFREHDQQVLVTKAGLEFVETLTHPDGSIHHSLVRKFPIPGAGSEIAWVGGIAIDITDRLEAEKALTNSEERFRVAVEASPLGVFMADAEGRIVLSNSPLAEMFGYAMDELLGERVERLVPERYRDRHLSFREGYFANPQTRAMGAGRDLWAQRKDGSEFPIEIGLKPVRMENGLQVLASVIDISARRAAEKALRDSEAMFRQLADAMPQIVWGAQPDGHLDYYNRKWYELTGAMEGATGDQSWLPILHPEDRQKCLELWYHSVKTGRPYQIEYRFRFPHKNEHRWHLGRALPVRDEQGRVVRWFGTCTDIHDQKQAEDQLRELNATLERRVEERTEALRESERRFRAIFHLQFQFIGLLTPAGVIIEANRTALAAAGVSEESVLGQPFWETVWWTHNPAQQDRLRQAVARVAAGEQVRFEASHPTAGGGLIWVDFSLTPYFDDGGRVVLLIPEGRDITERKRMEEELRGAKEAAEAASRAKSEFLANMSHEVRTPMNGVLGMIDLALDTELTAQQREYLVTVESSAEALLTVINDILDFSKIEAGKLDLDAAPFRLRDGLAELLKPLAVRAHKKSLEFRYDVRPDVPDRLVGDLGRLRQVLINLIGNAIKFTDQGGVVLHVEVDDQDEKSVCLHVSVADTGIGIPRDRLATIFAPFEQADGTMTRRFGGTGLGLTISARLVALMRGQIWVTSTVGRGSAFHFTVRLGVQQEPDAASAHAVLLTGSSQSAVRQERTATPCLRILLGEDNPVNQRIGVDALTMAGHQVEVANNGREVLAALDGGDFDLLLLDVQMPEMDGLEATALIRKKETATGRHLPIIALTAHAMNGDRERFLAAGMDGYVAKPVRPVELWEAIHRVLSGAEPASPLPSALPCQVGAMPGLKSPSAVSPFDHAAALARLGGKAELLRDVAALFRNQSGKLMTQIQDAVRTRDAKALQRAAHTLKGSVAFLGAPAIRAIAARLELMGQENRFDGSQDAADVLTQEVDRLLTALREVEGP